MSRYKYLVMRRRIIKIHTQFEHLIKIYELKTNIPMISQNLLD